MVSLLLLLCFFFVWSQLDYWHRWMDFDGFSMEFCKIRNFILSKWKFTLFYYKTHEIGGATIYCNFRLILRNWVKITEASNSIIILLSKVYSLTPYWTQSWFFCCVYSVNRFVLNITNEIYHSPSTHYFDCDALI